jgi:hypothetical protein
MQKSKASRNRYRKRDDSYTFLLRCEHWSLLCGIKGNLDMASQFEDFVKFKKVRNIRGVCVLRKERCDVNQLIGALRRELYTATNTRIIRIPFHQMKQEALEIWEQFAEKIQDIS